MCEAAIEEELELRISDASSACAFDGCERASATGYLMCCRSRGWADGQRHGPTCARREAIVPAATHIGYMYIYV